MRGVGPKGFAMLTNAVGIAREVARDRVRMSAKREEAAFLEENKTELEEGLAAVCKAVDKADEDIIHAEKQIFTFRSVEKTAEAERRTALADEMETNITEAQASLDDARQATDRMIDSGGENRRAAVKGFLESSGKELSVRTARMESRLGRVENLFSRFRNPAAKKQRVCDRADEEKGAVEKSANPAGLSETASALLAKPGAEEEATMKYFIQTAATTSSRPRRL